MKPRKTCDKCSHFGLDGRNGHGNCALMEDSSDVAEWSLDRVYTWDYEGYRAGNYVGPKFGCIHWVKKEKST